jgi:hypothetical protein
MDLDHIFPTNTSPPNFDYLDKMINATKKIGIEPLIIVDYCPKWLSKNTSSQFNPPTNITKFIELVEIVINHIKDNVTYYEIWNEPNLLKYWNGSEIEYRELLINISKIIKKNDQDAVILAPSSSDLKASGSILRFLKEVCINASNYFDVVSFHAYTFPPDKWTSLMNEFKQKLVELNCVNKSLWMTEGGIWPPYTTWDNKDILQVAKARKVLLDYNVEAQVYYPFKVYLRQVGDEMDGVYHGIYNSTNKSLTLVGKYYQLVANLNFYGDKLRVVSEVTNNISEISFLAVKNFENNILLQLTNNFSFSKEVQINFQKIKNVTVYESSSDQIFDSPLFLGERLSFNLTLKPYSVYLIKAEPSISLITVCSSGCDFTSIQSAINYANTTPEPDTIYIKEGVYTENRIKLYSNIKIIGDGIDKTIIKNKPYNSTLGERADILTSDTPLENVQIENLTVDTLGIPDNLGSSAIIFRNGPNKNIIIRNVKSINAFGTGIAALNVENFVIENCFTNNTWTGIRFIGKNGLVRNNTVLNTKGDGIFPSSDIRLNLSVTDTIIENNYVENIGDTGIDVTASKNTTPHERIFVIGNRLRNAGVRISNALNITFARNFIKYGTISVDTGQGRPINITIENNSIESFKYGISLGGPINVTVRNNIIHLIPSEDKQVGIASGVWQSSIIQNNVVLNPKNYCIDFNNWGVGGRGNTIIENNTLINCGDVGIYDTNVSVGKVLIKGNMIFDFKNSSRYSILTDRESNVWNITGNWIYNKSILAPNSVIFDNKYSYPSWFYFPLSLESDKFIFSHILQDSVNKKLKIKLEDVGFASSITENILQIFSPIRPSSIKINDTNVGYDETLSLTPSWKYDSENKIITIKFFC